MNSVYKSTFWIFALGIIFLILFSFSLGDSSYYPDHVQIATDFMVAYLSFICLRIIILLALSFYEHLNSKNKKPISSPPLVTVVIPCFNEERVIQKSIASVAKVNYPNVEILVVDDGSTDNTLECARESQAKDNRVRVISKANGGKATALNLAIQESFGDYVLCIDADSHIDPEVLNYGIPYFEDEPGLSAIAGNVRIENARSLLGLFQKLEYIIGLNFYKKAQSALGMVTIIPGPIGLFRKEALIEVGGYDSSTYAEDCDLTLNLLIRGHRIKYCSEMVSYTEAPQSFYELTVQRYRWSRGTVQAIFKNFKSTGVFKSLKLKTSFLFCYMVTETIIIPTINFLFAMLTIVIALYNSEFNLYGPFFLGLIVMDAAVALYSIMFEKEVSVLFFLSLFSRITYGLSQEIIRFYSLIDEILKIPMKWGVLTRRSSK